MILHVAYPTGGVDVRLRQDRERLRRAVVVAAGCLVVAVGVMTLVGWVLERPGVGLTPVGAGGLVAGGAGLALLGAEPVGHARRRGGRILGGLAAGAGVIELAAAGAAPSDPASPAAALALLLAGAALATLDLGRHPLDPADVCAPTAALIALAAALEQLHGRIGLPSVAPLARMPVVAWVVIIALAGGTVLARPARGVGALITRRGSGGMVSRRLAPLVLLPFATAALTALIVGLLARPAVAVTVNAALAVVVAGAVLARAVAALDRADAKRSRLLADLRDERDFSDTLLRSMAESVVVLDPDQRVIEANQQWCELVGRSRNEVIGQTPPYPWQPAGSPGDPDALTPNQPYPRLARTASDQYVQRADGTRVPVLATRATVPGPDGRPRAFVATYMDITVQKRSGDALAQQASLLERGNVHLRRTNERLEQAAAFSSDVTSLVSHEVSQPLTSIASLAELLVDGWAQLPDATRLDVVAKIDRNARRLVDLVREMLLLFQLDSGKVTTRRTPVLIADAVEAVVAAHPTADAVTTHAVQPSATALVDRSHLELVLTKLISNAVAYGRPPVEVSCAERSDKVVIMVTDEGDGIADDLHRRLFDRAVPPSTAVQGSAKGRGLGLYIARHLIEANGGTIWYEPRVPRGACLAVRLESASARRLTPTPDATSSPS